ncbi:MAG: VWA domain-containing protein [Myxococcales bacterium]|nr:VWA domain-containing protein [Polyangiaceae bacterium]MDW8250450.1 VWA domain-containing protein [Myxococcales bacterium]
MSQVRAVRVERSKSLVGALVALSILSAACAKREAPAEATATSQATSAAPILPAVSPREESRSAAENPADLSRGDGVGHGPGSSDFEKKKANKGGESVEGQSPRPLAAPRPRHADFHGFSDQEKPVLPAEPKAIVPTAPPVPVTAGEAAIDPNGRFATTYRPGGGHLSAFEAAVARGIIPQGERELVSDVGARYASEQPAPTNKTLAIAAELERAKLPPSGGSFHMRLSLRSTAKALAARPRLSVHLVLDVSGSMAGDAIANARKAAQALVDRLDGSDDFSLVTFSSDARVAIQDGPVGPRREQIRKTIEEIREGGGTNIGAGLELGYQQAHSKSIPEDAVKVVLLLSDGHVNSGILDKNSLARLALNAFQDGIQTSSFGLGSDYDGPLMSAIAADGAGGYYYLRDSEQIASALAAELDKRLDQVATAVEIRVRLKKGVELLHVYGSRRLNEAEAAKVRAQEVAIDTQEQRRNNIKKDRQDDLEGGMRFFLPAFARDDSHGLLLKLRAPEGVGSKPIALVELKYKDRVYKKNIAEEFPVSVEYAASDADSFASRNGSVLRTIQGFAAGETLAAAASLINRNERGAAAALLAERAGILREAAASLGEPLFLKDAERLERLRSHTQTTTGLGDPLVLAMLLETASHAHLR